MSTRKQNKRDGSATQARKDKRAEFTPALPAEEITEIIKTKPKKTKPAKKTKKTKLRPKK